MAHENSSLNTAYKFLWSLLGIISLVLIANGSYLSWTIFTNPSELLRNGVLAQGEYIRTEHGESAGVDGYRHYYRFSDDRGRSFVTSYITTQRSSLSEIVIVYDPENPSINDGGKTRRTMAGAGGSLGFGAIGGIFLMTVYLVKRKRRLMLESSNMEPYTSSGQTGVAPQEEKMPLGIQAVIGLYIFGVYGFLKNLILQGADNSDSKLSVLLGEDAVNFFHVPGVFYRFLAILLTFVVIFAIIKRKRWGAKLIIWWEVIKTVVSLGTFGLIANAILGLQVANDTVLTKLGVVGLVSIILPLVIIICTYKNRSYFNR